MLPAAIFRLHAAPSSSSSSMNVVATSHDVGVLLERFAEPRDARRRVRIPI